MKQSDGSSTPQLLDDVVFFIERPLGKKIGHALRDAGLQIVLHAEQLAETAGRGWVVVTADSDVHDKANQRLMVHSGRLRVFRLTGNHWTWQEKLETFVAAVPAMRRLIATTPPPFIARINRGGKIGKVGTLDDISSR